MLNKKQTLDHLRKLLSTDAAPMFFYELRQQFNGNFNKTVHFMVLDDVTSSHMFEVSFRHYANLKSIQRMSREFDETKQIVGYYKSPTGRLMLAFGDQPAKQCSCPAHPYVEDKMQCPYCGALMGAAAPVVVAPVKQVPPPGVAGAMTPYDVVKSAYDRNPAVLLCDKLESVGKFLGFPVDSVSTILGFDAKAVDFSLRYKTSLQQFGFDPTVKHDRLMFKNKVSFDEYKEYAKAYLYDYVGCCISHSPLTHEVFINLLEGHLPKDIVFDLELFPDNGGMFLSSVRTADTDFIQDFGQMFGRRDPQPDGSLLLHGVCYSYNTYTNAYGSTRNKEVAAMLPHVYDSPIKLTALTHRLDGAVLFAGSVIRVKEVLTDGTFIVSPLANDSVSFKIPFNFEGVSL